MDACEQSHDRCLPIGVEEEHHPSAQPVRINRSRSDPVGALRSHTRLLHIALENSSVASALLSPGITLARYAEILVIWSTAWQAIEQWLYKSPFGNEVAILLPRPRARRAAADLAYLSRSGNRFPPAAPPCSAFDTADFESVNLSGFIGICYVVVGASLGSIVIARHLDTTLAVNAEKGASFFSAGSEDDLSWTQWVRCANEVLTSENDIASACDGARLAFEILLTAFSASTCITIEDAPALCDVDRSETRMGS